MQQSKKIMRRVPAQSAPVAAPALKHQVVDVRTLKPHPKNPMIHSEQNLQKVMRSLHTNGQCKTISVWKGFVVAGHCTLEAAKKLGWKEIAITRVDHLSEAQAEAYLLMDNEASDDHRYDTTAVAALLQCGVKRGMDAQDFGLSIMEAEPLMRGEDPQRPSEFGVVDEDVATEHQCPKCGYEWSGGR